MFRKVAFLEISKSPLLTEVASLQNSVCDATKNELLTKFLKCASKLTENFTLKFYFFILKWFLLRFLIEIYRPANCRLCVFKTPKVASIVEFLSLEAGANGFSTE